MPHHVLVGYDESPQAEAALELALTTFPDAEVTVVHVTDPREWVSGGDEYGEYFSETTYDEVTETARQILSEAESIAERHGREIRTEQLLGGPGRAIVRYAREHDVDHVVVGSHGRTGVSRLLLGSVSERVVRRSPVPVTVMRSGSSETDASGETTRE